MSFGVSQTHLKTSISPGEEGSDIPRRSWFRGVQSRFFNYTLAQLAQGALLFSCARRPDSSGLAQRTITEIEHREHRSRGAQ